MGLIEDSVAARKAHMTYGQYKAKQPYIHHVYRFHGNIKKSPIRRPCEFCGQPVKDNRHRFCCRECYLRSRRGEQK